ncbi:MAG: methylmalonyl-CoA mutase family protein [Caulobacteraceae bacterium]
MPTIAADLAGFPATGLADWEALLAKTGTSREALTSRTLDGLQIAPLYAPAKGRRLGRAPGAAWDLRVIVRHPDPASAHAQIHEALEGGASSILLVLGREGVTGLAIAGESGFSGLLEGVVLEAARIALDAGFAGPEATVWLAAAAKASPRARLAFHLDPLGERARLGDGEEPLEDCLRSAGRCAASFAETYPEASFFFASGRVLHEAGASEAQELAFAAASLIAYARVLAAAGLPIKAALPRIAIGLCVDADVFGSIAKLRAARLIVRRIATALGAAAHGPVEARSSERMLTRASPWTNQVRLTAAGFSAAVGGADVIELGAYSDPFGAPDAQARRLSRNISVILSEEAGIGLVADPASGSGALEAMTGELARAAWAKLQEIEASGGASAALSSGLVGSWVEASREGLRAEIAAGERRVLGVTDFPSRTIEVEVEAPTAPTAKAGADALRAIRLEDLAR